MNTIRLLLTPIPILIILSILNFIELVTINWWIIVVGFVISLNLPGDNNKLFATSIDNLSKEIEELKEKK